MARGTELYTFKRDNLVVKIIMQHKGRHNAIKSSEICKILNENGYETKSESIHLIVSKIIKERGLPIVSSSSFGYCWGNSKGDFLITINELQSKIEELNQRIDHLKRFVCERS